MSTNEPPRFEIEDGPVLQALLAISTWHRSGVETLVKVLENVKDGHSLTFNNADGGREEVVMDEARAYGFRMGLSLALTHFSELPVALDFNGSEVDLPEVKLEELSSEDREAIKDYLSTGLGLPLVAGD